MATVPAELTWLLRRGLQPGDLFFLMGQATQHRHRLSDIVEAKKAVILTRALTGRALKAYLLVLTRSVVCFVTLAQHARMKAAQATEAAHYAEQAALFRSRFANVQFVSRDQTRLHALDAEGRFMRTWDGTVWRTTPLVDLRPTMRALQRGDLVLATADSVSILQQRQHGAATSRPARTTASAAANFNPPAPLPARTASATSRPTDQERVHNSASQAAIVTMRALLKERKSGRQCAA